MQGEVDLSTAKQVAAPSKPPSTWFGQLFGVDEGNYRETKALFKVQAAGAEQPAGEQLISPNGRCFQVGAFETPSLGELRAQLAATATGKAGEPLRVDNFIGDVREMHALAPGAVFQVASQFNCLEFLNASTTPEEGVTGYEHDHTQGPSCALACAASTVWRNYFLPMPGEGASRGQTSERQLNNLAGVQELLGEGTLEVRNGYAFCACVQELHDKVEGFSDSERDALRAAFRIGVQRNAEVTDACAQPSTVTQIFCSALSLGSSPQLRLWRPLAQLVLDAAYEATLSVAALDSRRSSSSRDVYLTLLGGGAFGNGPKWIEAAIRRALEVHRDSDLRVHVVHLSCQTPWFRSYRKLATEFYPDGATWELEEGVWSRCAQSGDSDEEEDEEEEDEEDLKSSSRLLQAALMRERGGRGRGRMPRG